MKFARYLQDTQVPEWKKAYIDYHGLKKYISMVKTQQENDDRRYRSSLYSGAPGRTHVLRFPTIAGAVERPTRGSLFRPSPRYSLTLPRGIGQPHTDIKGAHGINYPPSFNGSMSMSSQSKTLSVPMHEISPKFNEVEMEFIVKLDEELEKVDSFYLEREKEVKEMLAELKRQLQELKDHQRFAQRFKVEDRRLQFPLYWIASPSRPDTPTMTADGRFGAIELRRAKKNLRKAVLEHYKKLDALQNFRTLNLIGFQKVLKKWDKVTHMAIQEAYLKEKIEPSGFSSTKLLVELIKETEDMYTGHFARGDKKRALGHLRAGWVQQTHYFAMFRSGMCLGLAVPALASGLYDSFQASTRARIPTWGSLLLIYATLFIPVLFSLLVAINILVWTKVRINHVFIFGLNNRTKVDYQQYAEIPALLIFTLCSSFWLSFSPVALHLVSPTTWPLIWLGFNTFMLFNPLPVYYRSSRIWLIKRFARLVISGLKSVEFTDFWMGDQICSLNFSLTNLFFVACFYSHKGSPSVDQICGSQGTRWAVHVVLAILPFLCRFTQSLRRWYDSGLTTHLVNAGKYVTGMLMYAFYHYWRHKPGRGSLVLYILAAVLYSTYACVWDYLADWSVLNTHAKYPLLRDEVLCPDNLTFYYFAIITNTLIRFSWIMYLPGRGLPFEVMTFIVGMLEMLRRWQWNFLRVENEHLGNIDQYRVTRDVPLPYVFDSSVHDADVDDWDQPYSKGWWVWSAFTS